MCRRRQVCNVYLVCGHRLQLPDETITCDSEYCKFSPRHPPSCQPPRCTQTCWQYRQWPEQYSPNINSLCPTCSTAAGHKLVRY
ncbi:hypothetical protein LshimejAT787_0212280 [Lyophyllum shimeji]|uniref:Uncharacterized protein n=1 Tax=Lyophyllum shimeji TaxID=47721 RepID=A0A9P3UJG2_LYOSH|nr:hypothetical protein LshimejAT787_0212280 [Lyophyllum shimeji]